MSVFGTVADGMFRYFVCPNDRFVLCSLNVIDRDGVIYRILKAEKYQRILFVENDGSNYKIFAYDTLSELSYKHSDEFKKIDISNSNSIKVFYENAQGKQIKNNNGPAGLNLGMSPNLFGKKNDNITNNRNESLPEYGRRVVADFSKAEDFLTIFIKLLDALEYDKVQTAIVMQMDLLARVNSPKVRDFMDKTRKMHTGKNILLYVVEKKELLSNIVKRDEIHYLHPTLLEFFESARCDNGSSDVIEELKRRNIIVIADKIGSDEVANCLLRQKIIKKDARFENIPVSKVYSLAELLVEDLLNINGKKKHFDFIPEKVDNYISFLEGCLNDDCSIKELVNKCRNLFPREVILVKDNSVMHLDRITHNTTNYSIVSEKEKYAQYNEANNTLNSLIGLTNVKHKINTIMNSKRFSTMEVNAGHYAFVGEPGTGKTEVARLMGQLLRSIGVLSKGHLVEVKSADIISEHVGGSAPKTREMCEKARGGVFFLDEAYSLVNTKDQENGKFASEFAEEAYTEILTFMENNRHDICFIFAGYEAEMEKFISANSGMHSRIGENIIYFPNYSDEELVEILKYMMKKQGLTADMNFFEQTQGYIRNKRENEKDFGNARGVRNILTVIDENKNNRLATLEKQGIFITEDDRRTLTVEDLDVEVSRVDKNAFKKSMAPLNDLIGLQNVKEQIISIANHVENQVERDIGKRVAPGHYIFSGNPGTGKTEVAKLMGEIFKSLGVLKKGHVVTVKVADMIGKYQGEVEEKTLKLCESAIEGVFFLDEAYSLVDCSEGGSGYADENCRRIYEKIMTFMEENKNRVSFIFAGYKEEMRRFVDVNAGMSSRIGDNIIHFPDYSVDELYEIFVLMSRKEQYILSEGFKEALFGVFEEKKKNGGNQFGNARMVRELLEQTAHNQSNRIAKQISEGDNVTKEDRNILLPIDLAGAATNVGDDAFEQAMHDLNKMIGLDAVKNKIKGLFNKEKYALDKNSSIKTPGHYIFVGNPGTGKTEVAKLMGRIFRAIGLLKTDNVIRVVPKDLIGAYVGHTENITKQKCKDALGGILLVDEAYEFAPQGMLTSGDSTYGTKALETIMDFMTEYKTNLCVIFAGYEQEMEKVFQINSGFKSRFRDTIHFPDYSTPELIEIFKLKINKKLIYGEEFLDKLKDYFDGLKLEAPNNFGNARAVEQTVDIIMERRSNRLEEMSRNKELSQIDLTTLFPEDIPDIKVLLPKSSEQEMKKILFRKISAGSIENLACAYAEKSYAKQEISAIIERSILFVKTDTGAGTAFLISPDGYAVTCNHVIEGAHQISARLRIPGRIGGTDSWHECTVVNTRKDIDIAVIKLNGSNFPYLNIAKPERKIIRGEDFVLMGYPFGQMTEKDPTVFFGYISSSENQRDEHGFIQYNIDSQAKCGDSGAPIVSLKDGSVIGILVGSITNPIGENGEHMEEINYMRPITYLWEEFME